MKSIKDFNPQDIREVVSGWPPMAWLKDDTVHCVGDHALLIRTFCEVNRVPMTERFDAWSALCEPFLDTELSADQEQALLRALQEHGFTESDVASIRQEIRASMLAMTMATWEWQHYGLEDVRRAHLFGNQKWLRWTSEIACRPWKREIESGHAPTPWPAYVPPRFELRDRLAYKPDLVETREKFDNEATIFSLALKDMAPDKRPYHNIRHVEEALELGTLSYRNLQKLDGRWRKSRPYRNLFWALLFHDAIYIPANGDNERLSAELATETMQRFGLSQDDCAQARELILWTQKHRRSDISTDELRAMHDGDLGIFGLWPSRYDEYVEGVKREWLDSGAISEAQFNKGRLDFLRRFADEHANGDFYYGLDAFHSRMALENLHREIDLLSKQDLR
jgi:predicted metal-dependent HD superfamily phosphohydrolase